MSLKVGEEIPDNKYTVAMEEAIYTWASSVYITFYENNELHVVHYFHKMLCYVIQLHVWSNQSTATSEEELSMTHGISYSAASNKRIYEAASIDWRHVCSN